MAVHRTLAASVFLCLALAGCSTGEPPEVLTFREEYEANIARFEALEIEYEDAVVDCMSDLGFEYVPEDEDERDIELVGVYRVGALSPRFEAGAETYGWTTELIDIIADTVHAEHASELEGSAIEAAEFELALFGSPDSPGCFERSRESVDGFDDVFVNNTLFQATAEEVAERALADPRAVEWIRCFSMSGVLESVESVTAPFDALAGAVGELFGMVESTSSPVDREGLVATLEFDADSNRFWSSDPGLDAEIASIYEFEEKLVIADRACADEVGFSEAIELIASESEAKALDGIG